jgi:regulator of protease activity HflC (stomatin/prohibitin superfamily)
MLVFLLVAFFIFVIIFVAAGFTIVQQAETIVVERLGRYHRTLGSGINILIPIFDRPRQIEWRYLQDGGDGRTIIRKQRVNRIDLRETVYDFPKQSVITRDNVATDINALLYFQITDPVRAVYEIANLPDAIEKLTQTTLRNVIGELDLDETLTSRDTINTRLRAILDDAADKWGVKVNRVELQDISPPPDVKGAMEKQMRAERDRRAAILAAEGAKTAAILQAEGIKESEIRKAEGHKQARILTAEAEAEARRRVAEAEAAAIDSVSVALARFGANPASYLLGVRYIDALKEMVSGKDNKVVYLPYEASAVLSSLSSIREMLSQPPPERAGVPATVKLP